MVDRGYYEIEGKGLSSEAVTFQVPSAFLQHLQRKGPVSKFFDAYLLAEVLSNPLHILRGLKREDYDEGLCYVAFPSKRYRGHEIELPPPPGLIFLVFVRSDWVVMDWEWRKVDDEAPSYPTNWKVDFAEEVWP